MYTIEFSKIWKNSGLGTENIGDLSRRLHVQPGYNYVGQTNARQPLHIKCCGQVA
jgi:hypothetical protein